MRNAGLDEAQAGIRITRRNINNVRYADDTTLMSESEELKSLLMGREVGGGIRMGNTYKSIADSCQCMAKTTTIL